VLYGANRVAFGRRSRPVQRTCPGTQQAFDSQSHSKYDGPYFNNELSDYLTSWPVCITAGPYVNRAEAKTMEYRQR